MALSSFMHTLYNKVVVIINNKELDSITKSITMKNSNLSKKKPIAYIPMPMAYASFLLIHDRI